MSDEMFSLEAVADVEELAVHLALGMTALRRTVRREEKREPGHTNSIWMSFHRMPHDEQSDLTVTGNYGLTLEGILFANESIERLDAEKAKVIRALIANGAVAEAEEMISDNPKVSSEFWTFYRIHCGDDVIRASVITRRVLSQSGIRKVRDVRWVVHDS